MKPALLTLASRIRALTAEPGYQLSTEADAISQAIDHLTHDERLTLRLSLGDTPQPRNLAYDYEVQAWIEPGHDVETGAVVCCCWHCMTVGDTAGKGSA
jgi:hypothetical protein